jgi:hypothetical protein
MRRYREGTPDGGIALPLLIAGNEEMRPRLGETIQSEDSQNNHESRNEG